MKSAESIIAALSAVAIVAVVILSIFLFSGQAFNVQKLIGEATDGGTEPEVIAGGTSSAFYEEAVVDQESVVLRIVPVDDEICDYHLSYRVVKGYGEEYSREKDLTGISPENPVEIRVTRMADEWVDIFAEVRDTEGLLVWKSESGYA